MQVNFHTHTARCHHAKGTDREYVEAAIASGFSVLGFADHSPYWFPSDYYSGHRMRPGKETEDYVRSVLSLKEEYKNDITIYLGFEAEYYPLYFEKFLELIEPYPYDYLILGQHFIHNEIGGQHVCKTPERENPDGLADYVSECIEGMKTGRFFYIAHPDVFTFRGDPAFYETQMRKLCVAAKECGMPLEFNMLGFRNHRAYPYPPFWKIAAEVGNETLIGWDAHTPSMLDVPEAVEEARTFLREQGLRIVEPTTPIKRRFF